jgi:hypothetical protein
MTVPLDTPRYDAAVGFARFQVCAMNPFREGQRELDTAELAHMTGAVPKLAHGR